jgi:hypothetical protein
MDEDAVARIMPMGVIDVLEVVDVEHNQRDVLELRLRNLHHRFQFRFKAWVQSAPRQAVAFFLLIANPAFLGQ